VQPKLAALAAAPVRPATPAPAEPTEPSALGELAASRLMGAGASVLLMIHSAALRKTSSGKELGRLLRARALLAPFFVTSDLDPLRDFDHFLLARSTTAADTPASALLQYNVPRYRIRGAPLSLADSAFALPAPQIVVVAKDASVAAANVPHDFRLPDPAGDEAFDLYAKAPAVIALPKVPTLPAALRWLSLTVGPDGSGSLAFGAADNSASEPAVGHAPCQKSELRATVEALLDAVQP
jgi:hypothetical protein